MVINNLNDEQEQWLKNICDALFSLITSGGDMVLIKQLINETIAKIRENNGSVKNISDGHHTFKELYEQRVMHVALICQAYPDFCWKAKKHYDEETDPMFNDDFIVGINTPLGPVTYHFKLVYWDLFLIPELERGYPYDKHSFEEDLTRLLSLVKKDL